MRATPYEDTLDNSSQDSHYKKLKSQMGAA
jgi:hypothetical protein